MKRLILRHKWALGDTVLLTALVRDIHRAYPNQYEIQVDTHFTDVWWNNPYVTRFDAAATTQRVEVSWGDAIHWNGYARYGSQRAMRHILAWYHYDFWRKTGLDVPVTSPHADLHLSAEERQRRIEGRYWLILSGGKLDMTVKHWHAHRAQEVVDKLAYQGIQCVQTGAVCTGHVHPPLNNCINLVGESNSARDLFNLVLHADGVICGVTAAMHIAAAFNRPCVVYAGGREEPWFEAYTDAFKAFGEKAEAVKVPHKFLHTIGLLPCCDKQGCWKNRTVPLDPADLTAKSFRLCREPVRPLISHPVARCQDLITSDHVVEAVMDYYDQNVLPPIGTPRTFPTASNPELNASDIPELVIPKVELIRVGQNFTPRTELKVIRPAVAESRVQGPQHQMHPRELTRAGTGKLGKNLDILDHPLLGGKVTICVLCYGPHTDLAKKCLSSILATVPANRMDLRVATNAASPATTQYLETLGCRKIYNNTENKFKYPVMRDMLWDASLPIETKYVIWFDDDTRVIQPHWLLNLAQAIIDGHPHGFRMYGSLMYHDLNPLAKNGNQPADWFKAGTWYRGKPFRSRSGQAESPNGSVIDFAVGWCWAIATETIRTAGIPDIRLRHNGGDITIGEQVHQAGFRIKHWNPNKSLVTCPTREQGGRRGFSEKFPWDKS